MAFSHVLVCCSYWYIKAETSSFLSYQQMLWLYITGRLPWSAQDTPEHLHKYIAAPSHNLNRWWLIVNKTLRNILQRNFIWKSKVYTRDDAFQNTVSKMAPILTRSQCVATDETSHDFAISQSHLELLLLTWINFNPSLVSNHRPGKAWEEITYQFPNFNGCTVRLRRWSLEMDN